MTCNKIFKELLKLNKKKKKLLMGKRTRVPALKYIYIQLIGKKKMKRCSLSLVIQNLQIKTTIKYYYIPIKMVKIQNTNKYQVLTRMWGSRNFHPFPVGMQNGTVQLLWKTGWQFLMKLNTA